MTNPYHLKIKENHHDSFLVHAQLLVRKSDSQHASYLLIFNPLNSVIDREQHEKHLYKQSSHYRKREMFNCQSTHQLLIDSI